jgi:hypothetical protein
MTEREQSLDLAEAQTQWGRIHTELAAANLARLKADYVHEQTEINTACRAKRQERRNRFARLIKRQPMAA